MKLNFVLSILCVVIISINLLFVLKKDFFLKKIHDKCESFYILNIKKYADIYCSVQIKNTNFYKIENTIEWEKNMLDTIVKKNINKLYRNDAKIDSILRKNFNNVVFVNIKRNYFDILKRYFKMYKDTSTSKKLKTLDSLTILLDKYKQYDTTQTNFQKFRTMIKEEKTRLSSDTTKGDSKIILKEILSSN